MTKRLTWVGLALVAVVWGPYVYAELAREPLESDATPSEAQQPIIVPTPVAYEHAAPGKLEQALSASTQVAAPALPETPEEVPPPAAEPAALEPELAPTEGEFEPQLSATAATGPETTPPSAAAAITAPAVPIAALAAAPNTALAAAPNTAPAAAEPAAPAQAEAEAQAPAEPAQPEAAPPAEAAAPPDTAHAKSAREGVGVIPDELVPAVRSAFDKESRDVLWASREEPRLTKLLSGAGLPSHAISEVRCQSTVCRVAFNSGNLESAAEEQLYQRIREQLGPALARDPTSQEQHAAFYVLRTPQ